MRRLPLKGAIWGFSIGAVILLLLFLASLSCLPYRISFPPTGSPWYCSDFFYQTFGYLAFPVNLLTNDLSKVVYLAPLSLLFYVLIGFLFENLRMVRKNA